MKAEADLSALGNPCNIITQAGKSHYFAFSFSRKTNILHQQNLRVVGFSLDSPSGHTSMLPARYLQKSKTQSPRIHWESSFEADPKSGEISHCNQTQNPGQELGEKGSTLVHLERVKRSPESLPSSWTSLKSHQQIG